MVDKSRKDRDDILGDEDLLPADETDVQEAALDDEDDFEEDIDDEE